MRRVRAKCGTRPAIALLILAGATRYVTAHSNHGRSDRDYEKLIQLHLTSPMLRWQEIEAIRGLAASPNSKLIFIGRGGANGTLLDVKDGAP